MATNFDGDTARERIASILALVASESKTVYQLAAALGLHPKTTRRYLEHMLKISKQLHISGYREHRYADDSTMEIPVFSAKAGATVIGPIAPPRRRWTKDQLVARANKHSSHNVTVPHDPLLALLFGMPSTITMM